VRDRVRGAVIPETLIRRLEQASDPEHEGVRICVELIHEILDIPGIGGINLLTPGDIATIPATVHAAGLRT